MMRPRTLIPLFMFLVIAAPFAATCGFAEEIATELLGKFRNTHYYVVLEADYAKEPRDNVLKDRNGTVLVRVSTKFKRALDIEGSGKLLDGRVVNYTAYINKEVRYRFTDAPWGLGVESCELEPFRSIAVDPTTIPLGAVVKIDETVGMLLPDGSIHDGIWYATDIGGAIKKNRIDLFVGTRQWGRDYLNQASITHLQPLTVSLIYRPDGDSCVYRMADESGN